MREKKERSEEEIKKTPYERFDYAYLNKCKIMTKVKDELNKELGDSISESLENIIPNFFNEFCHSRSWANLEIMKTEIIKTLLFELKTTKSKLEAARWIKLPGKMNWKQANEMCERLQVRLPTKDELQNAYMAGIMDLWDRDGGYWSSDCISNGFVHGFYINDGFHINFIRDDHPCALIVL